MPMQYDWRKAKDACYERPLYATEISLAEVARDLSGAAAIFFATTLSIQPREHDFAQILQQAWKCLRSRHPEIATKIYQRGPEWIATYDGNDWDDWAQQSLFECPASDQAGLLQSVQQHQSRLLPNDRNYTVSLLFAKDLTSQFCHVVLAASHALFDGRACIMLYSELCKNLAQGSIAEPCENGAALPQPFVYAAKLRNDTETISQSDVDGVLARLQGIATSTQPQAFLPSQDHDNGRSYDKIHRKAINVKDLLATTKQQASTISSAVMVAVFLSLQKHAENTNEAKFTRIDMSCDARATIQHGGTYTQTALVSQPIVATADDLNQILHHFEAAGKVDQEFWRLASSIKSQFRQYLSNLDAIAYAPEIAKAAQPWLEQVYRPTVWPATLGNLHDRISSSYAGASGTVEVHDPCFTIKNYPGDIIVHIWTWQDQLHLIFNWHDGRYEQRLVESIASTVVGYLEAAGRTQ